MILFFTNVCNRDFMVYTPEAIGVNKKTWIESLKSVSQ